jgi:hypothetical protein
MISSSRALCSSFSPPRAAICSCGLPRAATCSPVAGHQEPPTRVRQGHRDRPERCAPNHGWRHRFKSVGRAAGIEALVLDVIQGHAPRSVGEDYGDVTASMIAEAIGKLPRIVIG